MSPTSVCSPSCASLSSPLCWQKLLILRQNLKVPCVSTCLQFLERDKADPFPTSRTCPPRAQALQPFNSTFHQRLPYLPHSLHPQPRISSEYRPHFFLLQANPFSLQPRAPEEMVLHSVPAHWERAVGPQRCSSLLPSTQRHPGASPPQGCLWHKRSLLIPSAYHTLSSLCATLSHWLGSSALQHISSAE